MQPPLESTRIEEGHLFSSLQFKVGRFAALYSQSSRFEEGMRPPKAAQLWEVRAASHAAE